MHMLLIYILQHFEKLEQPYIIFPSLSTYFWDLKILELLDKHGFKTVTVFKIYYLLTCKYIIKHVRPNNLFAFFRSLLLLHVLSTWTTCVMTVISGSMWPGSVFDFLDGQSVLTERHSGETGTQSRAKTWWEAHWRMWGMRGATTKQGTGTEWMKVRTSKLEKAELCNKVL